MNCNLCGSEKNQVIFDYARFEKRDILQCLDCGLVFLKNERSRSENETFYREQYRKEASLPLLSPDVMFNHPVIVKDCADRLDWIKAHFGALRGVKVLEVGCGSGYFLKELEIEGALASGIELSQDFADYAKDLGCSVYTAPIEDLYFANEFDLIVSFHTLEHVYDPRMAIGSIYSALKPGGVFMGEVPNQDDWRIRLFDSYAVKRFHYDPFHLFYFSPHTLKRYLTDFNTVNLESVERYDSLVQLKRILTGYYDSEDIKAILRHDILAEPKDDVRLCGDGEFNRIFGKGFGDALMGNCLRWVARK